MIAIADSGWNKQVSKINSNQEEITWTRMFKAGNYQLVFAADYEHIMQPWASFTLALSEALSRYTALQSSKGLRIP